MISHNDKPLEEMNFNDLIEFEKFLYTKMQQAHIAGVNEVMQQQIHFYIELVRQRKLEIVEADRINKIGQGTLYIGEDEPEQSNDTE